MRDVVWEHDIRNDFREGGRQKQYSANSISTGQFTDTQTIRRTFEREVQEVSKILAGNIKVFKGYEYGPWKEVGDERLGCNGVEEACIDLPEGELLEGSPDERYVD